MTILLSIGTNMKIIESVAIFGHITPEQTINASKYLDAKNVTITDKLTRFHGCSLPVEHPRECTHSINEITGISLKHIYLTFTDVE